MMVCSGAATTASLLVVTATLQTSVVLVGVFGVGVAISPVLPLAFSLAGVGGGPGRTDAAIAQLGVIAYAGVLAGPAAIGALAQHAGLRPALAVIAAALGMAIVVAALFLASERTPPPMIRAEQPRLTPVPVS